MGRRHDGYQEYILILSVNSIVQLGKVDDREGGGLHQGKKKCPPKTASCNS
jgi:hypothetical protein